MQKWLCDGFVSATVWRAATARRQLWDTWRKNEFRQLKWRESGGNTSMVCMMKSETNIPNKPGNRKMHIESSYIWDLNQVQHLSRKKKKKHFRESLQEITSSASDFNLACFLGARRLINIIAWHLDWKYIPEYKLGAQLDLLSLCIYCSELPTSVSRM